MIERTLIRTMDGWKLIEVPNYFRKSMSPKYLEVKPGRNYRVVKLPDGKNQDSFQFLGMIGKCEWTSSVYGACISFGEIKDIIPFDSLEEVTEINDPMLVRLIHENPLQTLKLLRGLWRMTKKPVIRNLMELGELPPDGNKTADDYDNNWEECLRLANNLPSECFAQE